MVIVSGSCRFELWFVNVNWSGDTVFDLKFSTTGASGPVPLLIKKYCIGKYANLTSLNSIAISNDSIYSKIFQLVREIPYGETATYGEIARQIQTSPRVVGQAMSRNPTPLIIPCHRIIGAHDIGGFSFSIEIKKALLAMEQHEIHRLNRKRKS
jgi:methylated-DNA-[protein]-cysteine S-methyltransferase